MRTNKNGISQTILHNVKTGNSALIVGTKYEIFHLFGRLSF